MVCAGCFCLVVVIGTVFNQLLLTLHQAALPLGVQAIALVLLLTGWAIIRYQPIDSIDRTKLAEAAAQVLKDALFLIDEAERVTYANPAAGKMSKQRSEDLIGSQLKQTLMSFPDKTERLIRRDGSTINVSSTTYPLAERGAVVLVRDLSPIEGLLGSIKNKNLQLRQSLKREQVIVNWLFTFTRLTDMPSLSKAWRALNQRDPLLQLNRRSGTPVS